MGAFSLTATPVAASTAAAPLFSTSVAVTGPPRGLRQAHYYPRGREGRQTASEGHLLEVRRDHELRAGDALDLLGGPARHDLPQHRALRRQVDHGDVGDDLLH